MAKSQSATKPAKEPVQANVSQPPKGAIPPGSKTAQSTKASQRAKATSPSQTPPLAKGSARRAAKRKSAGAKSLRSRKVSSAKVPGSPGAKSPSAKGSGAKGPGGKGRGAKGPGASIGKRRKPLFAFLSNRKKVEKTPKPRRLDVLFKGDTTADNQATQPAAATHETLWGSKLLFNLVLVRPWILVCGFWVLLVGTSAIALSGLADPGKPTVTESTDARVKPMQPLGVAPDTAVTSRLAESPVALNGGTSNLNSGVSQPLPVWSLWVMVGACAAGCIMLSRPELIALGASERRRRPIKASSKLARTAKAGSAAQAPTPRSRPQLKPNYPQGQVMAVSTQGAIQQVVPTPSSQTASKLVSFDVRQNHPDVAVIPADETHVLDWQDGSLAHRLDVRQNRSLKSFL
ncbi:MAG: hypothetical protein AAFN18_20055 [Cyanobacteria bacterium J06554_6]